ncbi:HAD hydrolase-like protein [Niveibacterium sp. SC-1]|uniref:HAD hydrolase-like protein n=1 Tax=Niveibacterium sp. SC-1 TaxID=3135646 RepID=UPI00311DBC58
MGTDLRGVRLVVFDFDGTLADSFPFFVEVFDTLADRHGFRRLEREQLDTLRGLDLRQMAKRSELPLWKLPRVAVDFRAEMARNTHRVPLFGGVAEMFERLARAGIAIAVLSSNSRKNVETVLGEALSARVDYWQCGASLFGKEARLKRLMAAAGRPPAEHVLMVGDEPRDIEAAKAVGARSAAVSWGFTREERLTQHAPDLMLGDPADLGVALRIA